MTWYSGLDGSLLFREQGEYKKIAKVTNWSLTHNLQVLDTTTLADTDRTLIDGVRSSSGSCRMYYYSENNEEGDVGRLMQKVIKPLRESYDEATKPEDWPDEFPTQDADWQRGSIGSINKRSTRVAFKLQANKKQGSGADGRFNRYFWVNAWITSITMQMAVGEILSADMSFEVDGAFVRRSPQHEGGVSKAFSEAENEIRAREHREEVAPLQREHCGQQTECDGGSHHGGHPGLGQRRFRGRTSRQHDKASDGKDHEETLR